MSSKAGTRISLRTSLIVSLLIVASLLTAGPRPAAAQQCCGQLTASEIVDRMVEKNAERAAALERYRGRRHYQIDYSGFPKLHAEMVVEMTYTAPATKTFEVTSSSGSSLLINRVLKRLLETEQEATQGDNPRQTALTKENYNFTPLEGQGDSQCPYVFSVEPKVPSKLLYRGRIWVDAKDFAVCRIEAEPAKNPDFLIKKTAIKQTYEKIGDFWLSARNESVSSIRFGGTAVLTISYEDYEIVAAREIKDGTSSPKSR
jgi:hypothetical protein